MKYLHRCPTTLQNNNAYKYHPKCAKLKLTNVCFVKDLLLFLRGDEQFVHLFMSTFQAFPEATGLKANPTKSKAYFGGTTTQVQQCILEDTRFVEGQFPFKYLGVPLSSSKLLVNLCQPLIDKMVCKIQYLSTKLLSYAWRKHLVQSVPMIVTG